MKIAHRPHPLLGVILLLISLMYIIFWHLKSFSLMPGDLGDARLNNYFLENIYQYLINGSNSLWNFGFFYPFQFTLGFSDNLFGTSPIYILARLSNIQSETAFQIWFLFGYIFNFIACYFSLKLLNTSNNASAIGALIFAFALPTTVHATHAQLHYRFAAPLALTYFTLFLNSKQCRFFVIAAMWLLWQLYSGIYIGFFTILFMTAVLSSYFFNDIYRNRNTFKAIVFEFKNKWCIESFHKKIFFIACICLIFSLLIFLFYPYLMVTELYSIKRTWSEISIMLPRPQSYLLADNSFFWGSISQKLFDGIAMRHEHQMFVGVMPLLLTVVGYFYSRKTPENIYRPVFSGSIIIIFLLTISIGGYSLWYLLYKFPLASAIRAMSRIDQIFLFPLAYFVAVGFDKLYSNNCWRSKIIWGLLIGLLLLEMAAVQMPTSSKKDWQERTATLERTVSKDISSDKILFFAQKNEPFYAHELDAMWVSMKLNRNTLNGYSGAYPPGYNPQYGTDCIELPKRVMAYLSFTHMQNDFNAYHQLIKKITPIGFDGCNVSWLANPPNISFNTKKYTVEQINNLSYRFNALTTDSSAKKHVNFSIFNSNNSNLPSQSSIASPLLISWRFLNEAGQPTSGWNFRKGLPSDIPPNASIDVSIPINTALVQSRGTLQISLVQEGVFWAHDIGLKPLSIPWK